MKNTQNERRKITDKVILWRHYLNIMCWLSLCLSLIWYALALPEKIPGFAKYKHEEDLYRLYWMPEYLELLSLQLLCCIVLACLAIWLNLKRLKRRDDHFHINMPVILAACLAGFTWIKLSLS